MTAKNQRANSSGFATIRIVVALVLAILLAAGIWWFVLNNQNTQSQLDSLKSQITQIEARYKSAGSLSDQDKATLTSLVTSVKDLQDRTTDLSQDTKTDIANLSKRIDALDNTTGQTGSRGLTGQTGANGSQGVQGSAGLDGAEGQTGPQGIQGATGATGATGAQGLQGPQGPAGADGATGPLPRRRLPRMATGSRTKWPVRRYQQLQRRPRGLGDCRY